MSELEISDATSAWWSPLVGTVLIALFVAGCWVIVHPRLTWTYVQLVYRRGRDHRRRVRNARHAQHRRLVRSTAR